MTDTFLKLISLLKDKGVISDEEASELGSSLLKEHLDELMKQVREHNAHVSRAMNGEP